MAKVIYLHIGAPKTGSTYLQGILSQNRRRLRRAGVLYPAGAFYASLDLRGARFQQYDDPNVPGAWSRLVEMCHDWPGSVIISHENFGASKPEHIERIVDELGPADLHVIYTARDLVRLVPAAWQEGLKNRGARSFEEFLQVLRTARERGPATRPGFWYSQDAAAALERWGRKVDHERLHLITVPPSGAPPELLWERFAGITGLDAARYDTQLTRMNTSVGAAEAAFLRRLNTAVGDDFSWPVYQRVIKGRLVHDVLSQREDSRKIALLGDDLEWARACAREIVDGVRAGGYDVVGDLDELIPSPSATAPPAPADDVSPEEQLDAAVYAVKGLALQIEELTMTRRELEARLSTARPGGVHQPRPQRLRTTAGRLGRRTALGRLSLRSYRRLRYSLSRRAASH